MKRLSRQRCYVHHEKGARASRPSVVVLRAAGAKVVLAVVGIRWGIGPGKPFLTTSSSWRSAQTGIMGNLLENGSFEKISLKKHFLMEFGQI